MRADDLAPFAPAAGLLAKMAAQPASGATDAERQFMHDRAAENLAEVLGVNLDVADRELHNAAVRGEVTEQYSATLAVISLKGRILYVLARHALRGCAHPERN